MKINKKNYEEWFLDYFEERLTPEQVEELMAFLELNDDLKEEFESFENITLPPAKPVIFDAKEKLKKIGIISVGDINEKNCEAFLVAEVEGDLSSEQSDNLFEFLEKNPTLKKELELLKKSKLTPDNNIVFDNKEYLKKKPVITVGEINEQNYNDFFIAELENDLQASQVSELKEFLCKNPHLRKDNDLFGLLKVTPDKSIVFDRKELLKKTATQSNLINSQIGLKSSCYEKLTYPVLKDGASQNSDEKRALAQNKKFIINQSKVFNIKKIYYAVSIAASLIIILTIYMVFNSSKPQRLTIAYRSNINIDKRTIQANNDTNQIIIINTPQDTSSNNNYYTQNNQKTINIDKKIKNNLQKIQKVDDFKYANISNPKLINEKSDQKPDKLEEINDKENQFVLAQNNNNEKVNIKQINENNFTTLSFGEKVLGEAKKIGKNDILPQLKTYVPNCQIR